MRVLVEGCKADGQGRILTMWAQKKTDSHIRKERLLGGPIAPSSQQLPEGTHGANPKILSAIQPGPGAKLQRSTPSAKFTRIAAKGPKPQSFPSQRNAGSARCAIRKLGVATFGRRTFWKARRARQARRAAGKNLRSRAVESRAYPPARARPSAPVT